MLMSKQPMLSSTHAIFRGLQEHIQQIYHDLPLSTPLRIKTGLLDAHQKLSDYYYKYDQSPFYTWAAFLNPHISYEGAKEDYSDDADLLKYLESETTDAYTTDAHVQTVTDDSPSKVNFTLRYKKKENLLCNKLQEYFKLPREDFNTCQLLQCLQPETICTLMLVKQRLRLSCLAIDKAL
ncbi:hypothetical protein L208DRAFT_1403024 [Tricholoma matsutake]|nr:hypothetical protein L208DRAFT_1403024 [Tricholoma matsutake 945]